MPSTTSMGFHKTTTNCRFQKTKKTHISPIMKKLNSQENINYIIWCIRHMNQIRANNDKKKPKVNYKWKILHAQY